MQLRAKLAVCSKLLSKTKIRSYSLNSKSILNLFSNCSTIPTAVKEVEKFQTEKEKKILITQAIKLNNTNVDLAEKIFSSIPESLRDGPIYATMLNTYAKQNQHKQVLHFFSKIPFKHRNKASYIILMTSCIHQGMIEEAEHVLNRAPVYLRSSELYNLVLIAWVKKDIKRAEKLFTSMPKQLKDEISYSILFNEYLRSQQVEEARQQLLDTPIQFQFPAKYVFLMKAYFDRSQVAQAEQLFTNMPAQFKNKIAYTVLLDGYAKQGLHEKTKLIFQQMPIEFKDKIAHTAMIDSYAKHGLIREAEVLFQTMPSEFRDHVAFGALIDGHMKQGNVRQAEQLFETVPPNMRTKFIYTAMVNGYAMHGEAKKAIAVFKLLNEPDSVSYLTLLQACSHKGLIEEAEDVIYKQMPKKNITPGIEHWNCLLDTYARKGMFDKAEKVLSSLPLENEVGLSTLLGACRNYGNVELAEKLFSKIQQVFPNDSSSYVLMANIYTSLGRTADADRIRGLMTMLNLKKIPGITSLHLGGAYRLTGLAASYFSNGVAKLDIVASDPRFVSDPKVKKALDAHATAFVVAGNKEDTTVATKSFESEEELLTNVCFHSERIAIALLDISTPPGSPMHMTNNLRVCKNCHNFSKFISRHLGRVLTLRDTSRYHRFENGECSCGDYW